MNNKMVLKIGTESLELTLNEKNIKTIRSLLPFSLGLNFDDFVN